MKLRHSLLALALCASALPAALDVSQLNPADVKKGVAVLGEGPDFLFAFESPKQPALYIDEKPVAPMRRATGNGPWLHSAKLQTGTSHSFYYIVDGQKTGGLTDIPAFGPDSYTHPGIPQG